MQNPTTPGTQVDIDMIEAVPGHPKHPKDTITVHVNEQPVKLPDDDETGADIKRAAIAQGVPIQADFILVEELGHDRTRVIGDYDCVHVTKKTRFLANDGDDNS